MSSSTTTDNAKFRRGIAALQKFSQNKRNKSSKMRYNPFSDSGILFTRKRVGIEEKSLEELLLLPFESKSKSTTSSSSQNEENTDNSNKNNVPNTNSNNTTNKILFDIVQYTHTQSGLVLPPLRERNEVAGATVDDLQVAKVGEIDNTGSFHWPAEDILAHLLVMAASKNNRTSSEIFPSVLSSSSNNNNLSPPHSCRGVLELGSGIGLAGFSLFAAASTSSFSSSSCSIFVSDGNPRVSQILEANCRTMMTMNTKQTQEQELEQEVKTSSAIKLSSLCLPWQIFRRSDESNNNNQNQQNENNRHCNNKEEEVVVVKEIENNILSQCQYIVGADCLFFESFHDDLIQLILRFFEIHSQQQQRKKNSEQEEKVVENADCDTTNTQYDHLLPKVVFVAPSRGGSRERFLKKLDNSHSDNNTSKKLKINWRIIEDYDTEITKIHLQEMANRERTGYDPDRHYPQVVEIFLG